MGETRDWLKFFEQAGIPRSASAQYAVTFIDNRISMDMLMDLNKEYLRDMGISKLGDIISILKQAKVVSQKLSADKALSNKVEDELPLEIKSPRVKKSIEAPAKTISSSVPAKKISLQEPKKTDSQRIVIPSKSPVSTRLGPPAEQKFAGSMKKSTANVFERLGHSEKMKTTSSIHDYSNTSRVHESSNEKYATEETNEEQNGLMYCKRFAGPKPERPVPADMPKFSSSVKSTEAPTLKRKVVGYNNTQNASLSSSSSHGFFNKKSHEVDWEKVPVQKRLGNIRPVPATTNSEEEVYIDKPKKVKYVMVQTLKDGSQIRKTLRPDDPLLKTVPISKTRIKAPPSDPSPPRKMSPVPKKIISTRKPYEGFSLNRSFPEERGEHYQNNRNRASLGSTDRSASPPPVRRPRNYHYEESYNHSRKQPYFDNRRKY